MKPSVLPLGRFLQARAEILDDSLGAVGGAGDGVQRHCCGFGDLLAHDGFQQAALEDHVEEARRLGVRERLDRGDDTFHHGNLQGSRAVIANHFLAKFGRVHDQGIGLCILAAAGTAGAAYETDGYEEGGDGRQKHQFLHVHHSLGNKDRVFPGNCRYLYKC